MTGHAIIRLQIVYLLRWSRSPKKKTLFFDVDIVIKKTNKQTERGLAWHVILHNGIRYDSGKILLWTRHRHVISEHFDHCDDAYRCV